MKDMHQRYEEALLTLKAENTNIQQEYSTQQLVPHAPAPPTSTKPREDPCKTVHEGNTRASRDNSSVQIVYTTKLIPFMLTIMQTPMLYQWIPLAFEKCDGSTDPNKDLRMSVNQMTFYIVRDPVQCITFSIFLKREALTLFNLLLPNSIGSLTVICSLFGAQFATSRSHHLTTLSLVNIKQEKGKSLYAFMK